METEDRGNKRKGKLENGGYTPLEYINEVSKQYIIRS